MKKIQILAIILISAICSLQSVGQIVVRPNFIFINSPEKSSSVTVRNSSENLVEVSIDFKYGYFLSDENGNFRLETADTVENYNKSLLRYLRVYPSVLTLAPEETRTVRIYLNITQPVEQGEYWARMYITPKILQKLQVKKSAPSIEVITVSDIPIIYRSGKVNTGLVLEGISDTQESEGKIRFNTLFRKTGNGAYWGNINLKLLDKSGKVKGSFNKNISVFKQLQIPVEINLEDKLAKIDKIQIIAESKRSDIDSKKLIQAKKEEWTIPFKSED